MRELSSPQPASEIAHQAGSTGGAMWKRRRHLLDTRDLTTDEIDCFLHTAQACKQAQLKRSKLEILAGKTIANIFYENSTRTRSSFEVATKRLGAEILNLDVKVSSVSKGETLVDTAKQLVWMGIDAIVQRHSAAGAADLLVRELGREVQVINAGDGWNAHPTQALLDLFTMSEIKPNLSGAKVAIIGDITHSRVARSNIWLLKKMGVSIHVAGPPTLIPPELAKLGVTVHNRLEPAIENADFVIMLRMQLERQSQGLVPSIGEYKKLYRLDHNKVKLCKPDVRVLHPGPINRGLELSDALVDDPALSLIGTQVANGVAARMAVLCLLLGAVD
jgi:aspartate carbamoyltransferase catalytic subunit